MCNGSYWYICNTIPLLGGGSSAFGEGVFKRKKVSKYKRKGRKIIKKRKKESRIKKVYSVVLLTRGRTQRIKHMMLVNLTHVLFLTCTQKFCYIYKSFIAIFTRCTTFPPNPTPCLSIGIPALLTSRTSFFAHGDEYPSTLVSGLPTTAPPLALPLSPFHTPQFKLHYLHRWHQQSQ